MSQINDSLLPSSNGEGETFANQNSWMVQCLSLAALGLMTYLHLAPMIA